VPGPTGKKKPEFGAPSNSSLLTTRGELRNSGEDESGKTRGGGFCGDTKRGVSTSLLILEIAKVFRVEGGGDSQNIHS